MFVFCFLFVGVWLFLCFLLGVFVLFVFSVTRIVSPPLSSHKSCGVLHLSQWKGTGLALATHVTLRLVFRCLLIMDCLYPRDLPQPARKKKYGHCQLVNSSPDLNLTAVDTRALHQARQRLTRLVRWALRFPLLPPSKDPSSTSIFLY